jgi:hypothetical protein
MSQSGKRSASAFTKVWFVGATLLIVVLFILGWNSVIPVGHSRAWEFIYMYLGGAWLATWGVLRGEEGLSNAVTMEVRWYHTVFFTFAYPLFLPISFLALLTTISYATLCGCLWLAERCHFQIFLGEKLVTYQKLRSLSGREENLSSD